MAKKSSGIGLRIRGLRISRGVSQGDLAKATSMNQSVLNRIEKGTRPARDAEISAIANFFDVSADWLLHLTKIVDEPSTAEPPEVDTSMFPLTTEEESLLRRYRHLNEQGRTTLLQVAEFAEAAKG